MKTKHPKFSVSIPKSKQVLVQVRQTGIIIKITRWGTTRTIPLLVIIIYYIKRACQLIKGNVKMVFHLLKYYLRRGPPLPGGYICLDPHGRVVELLELRSDLVAGSFGHTRHQYGSHQSETRGANSLPRPQKPA